MSRSSWKLVLVALLCAIAGGAITADVSSASGGAAIRFGTAPLLPAGSRLVGSLSSSQRIRVTVALEPRDPAALQSYATAVSTPESSMYRRFLSVAEFRQRFAATDTQIAAVESSLRAHGLSPSPVSANGLAISTTATAATLERAFSTMLERVSLAAGGTAFANTTAPMLDSSVAGLVQGVIGLDNLSVPRPLYRRAAATRSHASPHVATGGPQPCSTATSSAPNWSAYTTDQIASAYRFSGLYGAGDEGAGQTVALYELEGNFPSDITAFESCYGINTSVTYSEVDGGPSSPSAENGDGIETELDIENVIGLAPKANVIVYQGPNSDTDNLPGAGPYDTYSAIISQDKAQVISISWGQCEAQDTPVPTPQQDENTLFEEAATQGESVFVAAGDTGSEGCEDPTTGDPESGLAVSDPASQPFVTAAGGTTMPELGPPPTEAVWNDPVSSGVCADSLGLASACGGGGGISSLWKMPPYQSHAPASLHVINSNSSGGPCGASSGSYCREVPDVSADANPATGYLIYWDGNGSDTDESLCLSNALEECGWVGIGGTSGAAPLWAALMADTSALSACHDMPIGFANPALYGVADHAYAANFNDITSGNNDVTETNNGLYPAGPGYDMASGLGSPDATALAGSLCAPEVGLANPGSRTSRVKRALDLQIVATDSANYAVTYAATGLPPGLSIGSTTGLISGRPSKTGTYSVTVRAVDTRSSSGSTTFKWAVVADPPEVSNGSLTGVARGKPKLTFKVNTGSSETGITKLVVSLPKGLSFSRKSKTLRKAISLISGTGKLRSFKLKLSGGRLTITLPRPVKHLRVTVKTPGLGATKSLIKKAKHRTAGKLTVTVTVTDASHHSTKLTTKLKPS